MAVCTVLAVCICLLIFLATNSFALWRIYLHPFTWISIQYLIFFGRHCTDRSMAETVDAWIAISYVVFSGAFFAGAHFLNSSAAARFWNTVWPNEFPTGVRQERFFFAATQAITVAWLVLFVYMQIRQYGSFDQAAVAFYSASRVAETPWLSRIVPRLYIFSGASSAVALSLSLVRGYLGQTLFCLGFQAICVLAVASTGCRGHILLFALLDCFILLALRVRLAGWPTHAKLVVPLVVFSAAVAGIVGEIRGNQFESLQEIVAAYESPELISKAFDGTTRTLRGGTHRIITDDVAFCFQNYRSGNCLGWHTFFSIVTNPIPREVWPQKPTAFGTILALDQGAQHGSGVSLAAGLAGEGFAGYEYVGVIVMSAIVGLVTGIFGKLGYCALIYGRIVPMLMGLVAWRASVMFVRGDVLSAWATGVYPLIVVCSLAFCVSHLLCTSHIAACPRACE